MTESTHKITPSQSIVPSVIPAIDQHAIDQQVAHQLMHDQYNVNSDGYEDEEDEENGYDKNQGNNQLYVSGGLQSVAEEKDHTARTSKEGEGID